MFVRFTDSARECVVIAQDEARELGHRWIGTEHLMIAVAKAPRGLGGRVLRELGATPEHLRAEAVRIIGPGPLDRDALASEHLLLAIARVEDGVGAKALAGLGLTRHRLELVVEEAGRAA